MITAVFGKNETNITACGLCQWDYGQVLRIQGLQLPTAVEIHFSMQEAGGEAITRIGTTKDGVTSVVIPDALLEGGREQNYILFEGSCSQGYNIWAWVYLTDSESGQTEYEIKMPVKARSKPEAFDTPEEAELFREAIQAVNQSALEAEAWAHGLESVPESKEDNAKYYAGKAQEAAEVVNGFDLAEVETAKRELEETVAKSKEAGDELGDLIGEASGPGNKLDDIAATTGEIKKVTNDIHQSMADTIGSKDIWGTIAHQLLDSNNPDTIATQLLNSGGFNTIAYQLLCREPGTIAYQLLDSNSNTIAGQLDRDFPDSIASIIIQQLVDRSNYEGIAYQFESNNYGTIAYQLNPENPDSLASQLLEKGFSNTIAGQLLNKVEPGTIAYQLNPDNYDGVAYKIQEIGYKLTEIEEKIDQIIQNQQGV